MVTIGSLFSGVGGLELGLEMCGLGPVIWQCDSDPFARAVLEDRWPGVRLYRDVQHIDRRATRPHLICGGFPCQDVSVAGLKRGLDGERSSLWWQFRRIVRQLRPELVFIENVASGWRRWLPVVRRSLWRIGYASVPLRVRAADVGAPHERARVFVLARADGPGPLADGDGGGLEGLGQSEPGGLGGQRRRLAFGRYPEGWQFPPGPAGIHAWQGPKPAIRRAADGLSRWMDRARLSALGNAVVPHCAARAWLTLAPLVLHGR